MKFPGPTRQNPNPPFWPLCRLPPAAADKVDSTERLATLEAMSSFRKHWSKLGPAIAAPEDDHALVEADQRFQAALGQAIAAGGERKQAVEATVTLKKRRRKPSP